jgi:hypothetical protein
VAVRQTLNNEKNDKKNAVQLPHPQKVLRIATAIAGDSSYIAKVLGIPYKPGKRARQKNPPRMDKRLRPRRRPGQYSTVSWPAAYRARPAASDENGANVPSRHPPRPAAGGPGPRLEASPGMRSDGRVASADVVFDVPLLSVVS